ncbi:segregation and condensation protein A [Anaerosporobacter sp.]|uniref:segregation and condensation protein A n=1 Tax=Anaerosporobacter sp. TaxID=1872529 RepID=UPI00286F5AC9|nr:segregation/condensation protein A [Anaerosporobacter sp.]
MGIPVKLEAFEGPLDLLLHLIDKNKVNIYDIPIVDITKQYMEYIQDMETKDLDVMSEFLVMAATLVNIKARMLLPKEKNEEDEEIDPRQELVERLLEYKMFKFISTELKDKQVDAEKVVFKHASIPKEISSYREEVSIEDILGDLTLAKLHEIFEAVLKRQEDKIDPIRSNFGKIEKEEITLSDKMIDIEEYAKKHRKFSFRKMLEFVQSKMEVIVTFLGILELMKVGKIEICQDNVFEDIRIQYTGQTE